MVFFGLWAINWVTSLRIGQRRGFLGVTEIAEAGQKKMAEERKGNSKEPANKRNFKKDLKN